VPFLPQQSSTDAVILWNNAATEAARDNNPGTLVMVRRLRQREKQPY
jgi:hypothetical protein